MASASSDILTNTPHWVTAFWDRTPSGERGPEFYTFPRKFIQEHHEATSTWQKVGLRNIAAEIECFKNEAGFELVAQKLGVSRPRKVRDPIVSNELSD